MSQSGGPPMPARGAVAGVKADIQAMKEGKYDPRGHGNAFTHNFLNQKPWHPMNFRNQITKWEAEQKAIKEQKEKEAAQAEFQAEQESMRTMSYLSAEEQERYKARQSIAFMYAKPPGLEAALLREAAQAAAKEGQPQEGAAAGPSGSGAAAGSGGGKGKGGQVDPAQREAQERAARERDKLREDPFAVMLTARMNLQKHDRFVVKQHDGSAHGGYSEQAANQQLLEPLEQAQDTTHQQEVLPGVVADESDLALLQSMTEEERSEVLRRLRKAQKQAEKQKQLEEAQALLRAAGYDVSALQSEADKEQHKHKKTKKSKKKRKRSASDKYGKNSKRSRKSGRKRGRASDGSGGDSSDSSASDSGDSSDDSDRR